MQVNANRQQKGPQTAAKTREQTLALTQTQSGLAYRSLRYSPTPSMHDVRYWNDQAVLAQKGNLPIFPDANPFMSPRNDVNRMGNVARGLGPLQHNIALDSAIAKKESVGSLKSLVFCADRSHRHKKSAPGSGALEIFVVPQLGQNHPIALMRDDRRDILRAAVFLCITPFVTPRISSG